MLFGPITDERNQLFCAPKIRLWGLALSMLIFLGLILGRLVKLTVFEGGKNRLLADENRILLRPIPALRGVIFDRKDKVLTRNISVIEEVDFPGDNFGLVETEGIGREYPFGPALAHVVGYVDNEMKGVTGLEKYYDEILKGQDGAQLVEVDANGKAIRIVGEEAPISGGNIKTSLDINLQKAIFDAMKGRKGAVVAMDPMNGSILGLVSAPGFDPNLFQNTQKAGGPENQDVRESEVENILNDDVNSPLFNRAMAGEYPPGSIFKLVTATAGLENGKINPETRIEDTGEIRIGQFRYGNWYFDQYRRKEGTLNLVRAITRSNDIFFYKVGEWVGAEKLAEEARNFGLGEKLGIDLPGEASGLVPDPDWKEKITGERWFLGNTYHMAIGQGDITVTPLQLASMVSAVITGKKCPPHINSKLQMSNDKLCEDINISNENRNLILEGMVGVCSAGGTAFPFFDWNGNPIENKPAVACKTGTAQHGGKETKSHAWTVVAGPIEKCHPPAGGPNDTRSTSSGQACQMPNAEYEFDTNSSKRIVLVVLLEAAGEGSYEAAPVAKEILTEWFK